MQLGIVRQFVQQVDRILNRTLVQRVMFKRVDAIVIRPEQRVTDFARLSLPESPKAARKRGCRTMEKNQTGVLPFRRWDAGDRTESGIVRACTAVGSRTWDGFLLP